MANTDRSADFLEISTYIVPDSVFALLDQDDVWQDSDGSWWPIAAVPIGRALRLLGGLEIWAAAIVNAANTKGIPAAGDDPHGWLRARPFYKALAAQVGHDIGWDVRTGTENRS